MCTICFSTRLGEREIPWIFPAYSFDARSITDTIEQQLEKHGIGHLRCVAQSYDGAAVMSGAVSGVQTRFREKHPAHCYAHELNLVLCYPFSTGLVPVLVLGQCLT